MMPKMSGPDLAERLHEASPTIQVVFLTGRGDVDAARTGIHVGAYDFLLKEGFTASAVEGAVRGAAEKARQKRAQAELERQVHEANRLLEALHGMGAADKEDLTARVILARLTSSAKALVGATLGRALLFTPTHDEEGLVIEAAVGDGAEALVGVRLGPSEGIAPFAAMVGETATLERADAHTRYSHKCDEMVTEQPGFLCVPLRSGPVWGALSLAGATAGSFGPEALEVARRLAAGAAMHVENLLAHERAANFFTHVSEILVSILDSQDVFNRGHSRAVATLSDMVTRRLGLPDAERRNVHYAALLHDIGKTRIDPAILNTEGVYHAEARREMESHAQLGVEMLKPITAFAPLLPLIHGHHERWDGKGYPSGISGEGVPLGARIIAVADAFNAMTRGHLYAAARTDEEAIRQLEAGAGSQFDPKVVRYFVLEYRRHREDLAEA
jgi:putative nucleotidyltransferase with HDIG domain